MPGHLIFITALTFKIGWGPEVLLWAVKDQSKKGDIVILTSQRYFRTVKYLSHNPITAPDIPAPAIKIEEWGFPSVNKTIPSLQPFKARPASRWWMCWRLSAGARGKPSQDYHLSRGSTNQLKLILFIFHCFYGTFDISIWNLMMLVKLKLCDARSTPSRGHEMLHPKLKS